jgi:hypothetical protein
MEQNFLRAHTYESWIVNQEQAEQDGYNNEEENREEKSVSQEITTQDIQNETNQAKRKQTVETSLEIIQLETNKKPKLDQDVESLNTCNESNLDSEYSLNKSADTKEETTKSILRPGFDSKLLQIDDECFECKQTFRDPERSDLIMYLHAYSYKVLFFCIFLKSNQRLLI